MNDLSSQGWRLGGDGECVSEEGGHERFLRLKLGYIFDLQFYNLVERDLTD